MPDRVILTERRKELLQGDYDSENSADRMALLRLRNSTQTNLEELIQIAQSPHVNNSETLPAEKVGQLLQALYIPTVEPKNHEEYRKELLYHIRQIIALEIERAENEQ